ncbi:MAG: hypothetical protein ACPLXC_02675 [Candidatus Pacearchaeota archaeon]
MKKIKKKEKIVPDFFAFESEVKKASERFLKSIPKKLIKRKKSLIYIKTPNLVLVKKNSEPICCLLSATYALAKIGIFKIPNYKYNKILKKEFYGNFQITILPIKYFNEEEYNTKQLIKVSQYKSCLNKMLWVCYTNRKIPTNQELKRIIYGSFLGLNM